MTPKVSRKQHTVDSSATCEYFYTEYEHFINMPISTKTWKKHQKTETFYLCRKNVFKPKKLFQDVISMSRYAALKL